VNALLWLVDLLASRRLLKRFMTHCQAVDQRSLAIHEEFKEMAALSASTPIPREHLEDDEHEDDDRKFSRAGRHSGWPCFSYLRTVRS
jgi:hypothetical protein